jgi:PKD repeat protein
VSDPENDPLRYEWHFGNTNRMYSKNVAYRYPMPGNWHTELFVSDGTHTVSKPITIQVVPVGTVIPPPTVPIGYIGNNPSNLVPGDISIATKADLDLQLGGLNADLGSINADIGLFKDEVEGLVEQQENGQQQLIVLQNQRDQIIDRLSQLNDPNYVQQLIQEGKDGSALLQGKYELLAQTTDPAQQAQLIAEIAAIEAQIEAEVLADIDQEKVDLMNQLNDINKQIADLIALIDQLDASIFDINKQILDLEKEANDIIAQIKALDTRLSGDFLIEGTASGEYSSSGTKFFLYGNLPMETNRAIFVEWQSGDGRSFVGQDATLRYPDDGIYNAKLIVTDGISTVSDEIGIKIDPKRAPRRRR